MIQILLVSKNRKLHNFCLNLQKFNIYTVVTTSLEEVSFILLTSISLLLIDFELINSGGNKLLEELTQTDPLLPHLIIIKETAIFTATKILPSEVQNILPIPCSEKYLSTCIYQHIQHKKEINLSKTENEAITRFVGISKKIQDFKNKLVEASRHDMSVLILGATGTGKSLAAWILHNLSKRCNNRFIQENIAAIQETLIEGELFGTKAGAYTGSISRIGLYEAANKGTLFLDEISCIKTSVQAKLLQVLETGEYRQVGSVETKHADVRLISATNLSLEDLKNNHIFRTDFYYRISGVQLYIPPLIERVDDIIPLSLYFLEENIKKTTNRKELRNDALTKLKNHSWPGNVRELERCIESAYCTSSNTIITARDIIFLS